MARNSRRHWYHARPDGTVNFKTVDDRDPEVKRRARPNIPACPECLKIRNPDSESEEVRQQYVGYCVEYALPESERRRHELEAEYARRMAWEEAQREGPK
jgi:hypothetical protein